MHSFAAREAHSMDGTLVFSAFNAHKLFAWRMRLLVSITIVLVGREYCARSHQSRQTHPQKRDEAQTVTVLFRLLDGNDEMMGGDSELGARPANSCEFTVGRHASLGGRRRKSSL